MRATTSAKAIVDYFCKVGIPLEILTDQGTNFISEVMKQSYQLLCVKHVVTSVYHP